MIQWKNVFRFRDEGSHLGYLIFQRQLSSWEYALAWIIFWFWSVINECGTEDAARKLGIIGLLHVIILRVTMKVFLVNGQCPNSLGITGKQQSVNSHVPFSTIIAEILIIQWSNKHWHQAGARWSRLIAKHVSVQMQGHCLLWNNGQSLSLSVSGYHLCPTKYLLIVFFSSQVSFMESKEVKVIIGFV